MDVMKTILEEVGLTRATAAFRRHRIQPHDVQFLTQEEFDTLGVSLIGEQQRLKYRCATVLAAGDRGVGDRLEQFRSRRGQAKGSTTLKCLAGWRHEQRSLQTCDRKVDIEKSATFDECLTKIQSLFFPNDLGINLDRVKSQLVFANGIDIRTSTASPFMWDSFVRSYGKSPVRLYLRTKWRNSDDELSDEETHDDSELPDIRVSKRFRGTSSDTGSRTWTVVPGCSETPSANDTTRTPAAMVTAATSCHAAATSCHVTAATSHHQPYLPDTTMRTTGTSYHPTIIARRPAATVTTASGPAIVCTPVSHGTRARHVDAGTPTVQFRVDSPQRGSKDITSWPGSENENKDKFLGTESDLNPVCPICAISLPALLIEEHVERCLKDADESDRDERPTTLEEALELKKAKLKDTWNVSVIRDSLYETACEELNDKKFKEKLCVTFIGEEGVDDGGLTFELFTELFTQSPLFKNNTFAYNAVRVAKKEFVFLGQLVAYALVLGHPGPRNLHQEVVRIILKKDNPPSAMPEMIASVKDEAAKAFIKAAQQPGVSKGDLLDSHCDLLQECGISSLEDLTSVCSSVAYHTIVARHMAAISQFQEGLNLHGVLTLLQNFPGGDKPLLETCLSSTEVLKLFTPHFSADDIKKSLEVTVVYQFNRLLKRAESGEFQASATKNISLADILQTLTGCRSIRNDMKGIIIFEHEERLSSCNTCVPSITFRWLKVTGTREGMERHMKNMVLETGGRFEIA